jgi:hypothetical protein
LGRGPESLKMRSSFETPFAKPWCGQPLAAWTGGAVEHEADHGEGDHGFGHRAGSGNLHRLVEWSFCLTAARMAAEQERQ